MQMDTVGEESCINLKDDIDLNYVDGVSCDGCSSEDLNDDDNNDGRQNENANRDDVNEGYKRITELTSDDIWGLEFGSESKAIEFYRTYARCHGFVVRKDDVSRDFKSNIVMRQLVCNREGLRNKKHYKRLDRIRDHRPNTRTKCPAKMRIHLDYKTSKWKVVAFEESHNHELTPAQFVHLIPAYRVLTEADKAQVESLHLYGVRTCHIMGLMLGQKGGYADLGFCKKDLHNHLDKQKRTKIQDGDAFAALSYLQAKADNDPMLFSKFTTTNDGRLQHLFWSDGSSRIDYECFGDVLAFDTTYKKNKYNKPLVIFVGNNHHGDTVVFACALVADEKVETYKWVLETFLEAMFNKHPNAVVTDGDGAMREAIKEVFPNASHRLCSWHLQKNACENVKNANFLEDFKVAVYSNFTPDEFEDFWKRLIDKYGLSKNKWVKKTYENKGMWATAYLRDKFFGGIRTTSQCEGLNSFIKRYVQNKNSLVDFMHNFERAVKELRHNELLADFKSIDSEPVMTTSLYKIEVGASKIFTRNIFQEVKNEIEGAGALNVIERSQNGNNVKFKMNRFCRPTIEYEVMYDEGQSRFLCDCRMFESRGIPCSHIFCAMKHEHMDSIPSSLICKRWTKAAKNDYISSIPAEQSDLDTTFTMRFGALSAACNRLCHLAAKELDHFMEIREEIFKLIMKLEKHRDPNMNHNTSATVVGDPTMVKTKGAPRKKKYGRKRRRCSHCKRTGHTIRKCPQLLIQDGVSTINEEISSFDSDGIKRTFEDDVSFDENGVTQTSLMQTRNHDEMNVKVEGAVTSKRKYKKLTCSTQNSVKESIKHQKVDVLQANVHAAANQHKGIDNNLMPYGSLNRCGPEVLMCTGSIVAPHNANSSYRPFTQGLPSFPQYSGAPVHPQIPQVPIYHQNHCFGLFPQYFTGSVNVRGGNLWPGRQQEDPKTKK